MTSTETDNNIEHSPKIGGLLYLVGLGVLLRPFYLAYTIYTYLQIFNDISWRALMQPIAQSYLPWLKEITIIEFIVNTLMFFVSIYMIYLFFNKKRAFPMVFIGYMVFQLIFHITITYIVSEILSLKEIIDPQTIIDIKRIAILSMIWIPYMMLSERVKTTFVK